MTACRGVRGATTVENDDREQILKATRQLLALLIRQNRIDSADIASAQFTVTEDLKAEFPALAARQLGWIEVPMICGYEISVGGSLKKCIRVMLLWNTDQPQSEIHHVYLHKAKQLRPDLAEFPPVDFAELEQWIQEHLKEA
ncbi:Chorismate mutase AroH [Planctomycetes bacterium CA13]|uniref:chorismate mutase n=1 Tax=Novipirellula herctigrandis TaxID=2527986 RepID=A0A5C5YXX0_9BACT|nr:Chorismate mutase AroH [Planctomycetes bacterium CA13]